MEPDRDPADPVVARVVAWHNRHPLAETISAAQVEGVGLVNLPFAIRGARVEPVPQPALPAGGPPMADSPPAAAAAIGSPAPASDRGGGSGAGAGAATAAVGSAPEAQPDGSAGAGVVPGAGSEARSAELADADAARPVSVDRAADEPPHPAPEKPLPTVHLPPRPPRSPVRYWWQRMRRNESWRALFTEDFIPPLSPGRVARWAAQHGSATLPLGRDAPQRFVTLDASRRRGGDGPEVDLYLLTAAVVVRGSRRRVLLTPDEAGGVIGPRHWSRPRSAAAGSVAACMLALGASAMAWRGEAVAEPAPVAAAASAVGPIAQASVPRKAPASPLAPTPPGPALPAGQRLAEASPSATRASAAMLDTALTSPPAAPARAKAPLIATEAETPPSSRPISVDPQPGRVDLPPIKPRLAEADRQSLKKAAAAMRGQGQGSVRKPAWALVTRPTADRRLSERAAAQFEAVAAVQPTTMRAELMRTGAAWRAVFWPFASARDAEKARIALADKGLRTEVVEF